MRRYLEMMLDWASF